MTKREYLKIKNKPIEEWSYEECKAADKLLKRVTLAKLNKELVDIVKSEELRSYIMLMVYTYFGSAETDTLLNKLKVYPDWF